MRLGMRQSVAAAERIDARMFEEAPDNRLDANVSGKSRHAGAQAADAAHDDLDAHAGGTGRIQCIDDLGMNEGIAFEPDRRWLFGFGEFDLLRDVVEQLLLE